MNLTASMLSALRCFEVAGRHGNFTRAAAELNITPGAVSQHIRHLESDLGVVLFTRLPRGLMLNDEGRKLHLVVGKTLTELSRAVASVRQGVEPLRITCSPSFAMVWLMPRLSQFHREHSEVEVKLTAEFQRVDRNYMLAVHIDCAIRYDPDDHEGLDATTLMDEKLIAVASPEYAASLGEVPGPQRVLNAQLLKDMSPWDGAPHDIEWQTWLEQACLASQPIQDKKGQEFNLAMLSLSAAKSHQGVAMGRLALVADDLASGALVDVGKMTVLAQARYVLLSLDHEDARVNTFVRWIKRECALFVREQHSLY